MIKHNVFWGTSITEGFKKSYDKLSLCDKWSVKHFLNDLRYTKDPKRHYSYKTGIDSPANCCLFGISDDKNKDSGVAVLIIINQDKTLTGILARRIRHY